MVLSKQKFIYIGRDRNGDVVHKFEGRLKAVECEALNQQGKRCQRKTVIGTGLCWQHLRDLKHLRIQEEKLAPDLYEKGLKVEDPTKGDHAVIFKEGDIIMPYDGDYVDDTTLNHRYWNLTAPYGLYNKPGTEDAALNRGIGAVANGAFTESKMNARFGKSGKKGQHPQMVLKATKKIKNHQFIRAYYGGDYLFPNQPDEDGETYDHITINIHKKPPLEFR